MKLAQPCLVTRIAPQALPRRAALYQSHPLTKPHRSPEAKASPAPRIFCTSTGKPGTSIWVVELPLDTRWTHEPSAPRFWASTRGPRPSNADIEGHRRSRLACRLSCEERGTAARLLAQVSAGNQQDATIGNRGRQHIINVQLYVGRVFTVVRQWEPVWRLDAQDDGTRTIARFTRNEAGFDSLALEKVHNEITDLIVADRGQ